MGEFAAKATELEKEVAEARRALEIVDRIGEELDELLDEVRAVGPHLMDLGGELDVQIADSEFDAVERSAAEIEWLVSGEHLVHTLDRILTLRALLDGSPLPDPVSVNNLETMDPNDVGLPRLTQQDLDREYEEAIKASHRITAEIWGEDADDAYADDRHESREQARLDAIKTRASRAGRHLIEITNHLAETVCPELFTAAEAGDRDGVLHWLSAADAIGRTAPVTYKLYELNLS